MSGIHDAILNHLRDELEKAMITSIPEDDPTRAGVVTIGDLQGDPDPDSARISVSLYENDPDGFVSGAVTSFEGNWHDELIEVEIGNGRGVSTWARRFTVKARVLLDRTKERREEARRIASTVQDRIERTLSEVSFDGIDVDGERVSRPILSTNIRGELLQSGGPPNSFDFFIKFRFDLWTTR